MVVDHVYQVFVIQISYHGIKFHEALISRFFYNHENGNIKLLSTNKVVLKSTDNKDSQQRNFYT